MKGTEVQQCIYCTCVLTRTDHCMHSVFAPAYEQFAQRFQTLSGLPLAFCFVPAYAKFAHKFLTLFHRSCATCLYFS